MLKHYFEGVSGINIYPIFSLLVFFVFFLAIATWLMKADKKHLEEMSRKPLESNESNENTFTI
ncbi:MAG: cytochrome C oxidase Cbb3 [Bacteroidetes bacterium]|nr:cytochrome C oxidase Cbb3 [Bacteroidota bacterium]